MIIKNIYNLALEILYAPKLVVDWNWKILT